VRGHRAIAQFPGAGRVVDDRYSASDCSRKAIVCQLELLNGGFRFHVVNTRPRPFAVLGVWGATEPNAELGIKHSIFSAGSDDCGTDNQVHIVGDEAGAHIDGKSVCVLLKLPSHAARPLSISVKT